MYRLKSESRDNMFYIVETTGRVGFPEFGALGHFVLVDFAVLQTPDPDPDLVDEQGEWEVVVKHGDRQSGLPPYRWAAQAPTGAAAVTASR